MNKSTLFKLFLCLTLVSGFGSELIAKYERKMTCGFKKTPDSSKCENVVTRKYNDFFEAYLCRPAGEEFCGECTKLLRNSVSSEKKRLHGHESLCTPSHGSDSSCEQCLNNTGAS